MNVRDIVRNWLERNGFDGLLNRELECGCSLSDLEPCDGIEMDCEPGYKSTDPIGEVDFIISPDNPPPGGEKK